MHTMVTWDASLSDGYYFIIFIIDVQFVSSNHRENGKRKKKKKIAVVVIVLYEWTH